MLQFTNYLFIIYANFHHLLQRGVVAIPMAPDLIQLLSLIISVSVMDLLCKAVKLTKYWGKYHCLVQKSYDKLLVVIGELSLPQFVVLIFDSCIWVFIQVTYDTAGFLEKNRDLLHLDSIQLLSSCSCHLPQIFASNMLTQSEKPIGGTLHKSGGAESQKLSVARKFKVIHLS